MFTPGVYVSLMADSVTRTGDRLCTVLARDVPERDLAALDRPGWTVTRADRNITVVTGGDPACWPGELGARLDPLAGWPQAAGADGLHAPFLAEREHRTLDTATRAALSAARAAAGGHSAGLGADLTAYQRLLVRPAAARAALHHVAVPLEHWVFGQHTARTGTPVPAGRYPGWLSWGELLAWHGPLTDDMPKGP